MRNIEGIKINLSASIRKALQVIDNGAMKIALVVDENDRLIGTLTDGDIRRGLLDGLDLNSSIDSLVFKVPTIAKITDAKEEILKLAVSKKIHQVPIVDEDGKVVGLQEIEELIKPSQKQNKVILMVGGVGSRLHPLTQDTPKPMLKVGSKPILQTIVERFAEYGFVNIVMCVNYKADMIREYFGDGSEFGVHIEYVLEQKRMGTAGALSLLAKKPEAPFFVMNGDLLTNVNFESLLEYHLSNNAIATMCVREYDFQVPFGVVSVDGNQITCIEEKPVHKFFVSAGIYVFSPQALKYIPKFEFYDMPTLFEKLITDKKMTISFPIHEYWLDIGRMNEYEKANREYREVFG